MPTKKFKQSANQIRYRETMPQIQQRMAISYHLQDGDSFWSHYKKHGEINNRMVWVSFNDFHRMFYLFHISYNVQSYQIKTYNMILVKKKLIPLTIAALLLIRFISTKIHIAWHEWISLRIVSV